MHACDLVGCGSLYGPEKVPAASRVEAWGKGGGGGHRQVIGKRLGVGGFVWMGEWVGGSEGGGGGGR